MQKGKIKVGVYLPNGNIRDVELSNPETGNPGIGGTQFLLFSLPYYLNKYYKDKLEIILFAEYEKAINTDYKVLAVDNLIDAAQKAKDVFCDMIIFRPSYDNETLAFLNELNKLKIKAIAWMHNTPIFLLNHLHKNNCITRCICVGREQYETLRDHPIINKLSMIFNAVDSISFPNDEKVKKTKTVVYLGSLVFAKGFHLLAKIWRNILKSHPDAKLYVIGSGKLYDRNQKLGPLGIADEKYEKMFGKYILNDHGEIHQSIKFLGVMGNEKYEIMNMASVGISNPTGISETFCLSSVEFQLCGTPVVSAAKGGLLDTVEHGTSGFLTNNKKNIIKYINMLLSNPDLSFKMGSTGRAINRKFNYENIIKDWFQLISDVQSNSETKILRNDQTNVFILKKIREYLRILKYKVFIFKVIPPSIYILHTIEFVKLKIQKLIL